jgi:hypothetical protein
MKRLGVVLALLAAVSLSVAGCGGAPSGTGASAKKALQKSDDMIKEQMEKMKPGVMPGQKK